MVGPEGLLAAGIVDAFRAAGLKIFGPTKMAAQLEASKDFSKAFMLRHGIPTAAYAAFSDPLEAHHYIDQVGAPIVIKADGLAAGKGVVVAMTMAEAHDAVDAMLVANKMGDAGARVVIEEFLRERRPASSSWRMARMYCHLPPAKIINACKTAIRGQIPGAWGPTPLHR